MKRRDMRSAMNREDGTISKNSSKGPIRAERKAQTPQKRKRGRRRGKEPAGANKQLQRERDAGMSRIQTRKTHPRSPKTSANQRREPRHEPNSQGTPPKQRNQQKRPRGEKDKSTNKPKSMTKTRKECLGNKTGKRKPPTKKETKKERRSDTNDET